ncbi:MAG: hypothetical protein RTV31_04995 [Candidatus Thorarchaeota archaeon]
MKNYETGVSSKAFASVLVAVIITAGVFVAAINFPSGGTGPTIPTPPTNPSNGLGARAAIYLNSMRDNVVCYWMMNSTFVNNDLTDYYDGVHPGAFVAGVSMIQSETGGEINVLFAPWQDNIVGTGTLTENEWNGMSGALIDDGIGQMEEATEHPTGEWPHTLPIDFYMYAFFNDSTYFYFGFTSSDSFVFIQNGTWTGSINDEGGPRSITYDPGYWLVENGHLEQPLLSLYNTITTAVSYPE